MLRTRPVSEGRARARIGGGTMDDDEDEDDDDGLEKKGLERRRSGEKKESLGMTRRLGMWEKSLGLHEDHVAVAFEVNVDPTL